MPTTRLYQKSQRILAGAGLAMTLGLLPGCGPELSPEELGTVVFETPPPSDEPYPLPKLGEPPAEDASHGHSTDPPQDHIH